jgi:hypothetical protein
MDFHVNFGFDEKEDGYFALVGNPFMSTIDFEAFYGGIIGGNSDYIKDNFQVWTDPGFSAYNKAGGSGIIGTVSQYISPMQSFFVEKKNGVNNEAELRFDLAAISATEHSEKTILRSSPIENISFNKLNITASNDEYKVLTYIAEREYGSAMFSDADSRKIIPGISDVPEIYTLKDSDNGRVAVGSNIINSDALVPLGLATAYQGELVFTFSGMDRYDARITFIDLAENKEVDLTGMTTYDYRFHYMPKESGDDIKAEEERFFIRIEKVGTNVETIDELIQVYSVGNMIYAISGSANPIRQIEVYNLQGDLLYSGKNINAGHCTVTLGSTTPQICLVRLITEQGVKSVKLIMNK